MTMLALANGMTATRWKCCRRKKLFGKKLLNRGALFAQFLLTGINA